MITGRPLYVNEALNAADAFVVAWLPGSEAGGIADVLVGDAAGEPRFDFSGKLPAAWPKTPDMADGALFDFGYGLTYGSPRGEWAELPLASTDAAGDARTWFSAGNPAASWSLHVTDPSTPASQTRITTVPAEAFGGRMQITAENYLVQEGARRFRVSGGESAVSLSTFNPVDISRETNGDVLLLVTIRMDQAPEWAGIAMGGAGGPQAVSTVQIPEGTGFVRYGLSLKCLRDKGVDVSSVSAPFIFATEGPADFSIGEVRLGTDAEVVLPCA